MTCAGCNRRKAKMRAYAPQLVKFIDKIPWPLWLFVGVVGFLGVIRLTILGLGWA